ncbi:hypothetical protein [Agromyces sp. SYSU T00266]|uniref:hypothetical protein n=1 Tax=Agromyces zhanjiangensis TaxID=3158562 RepID=UPI0033959770
MSIRVSWPGKHNLTDREADEVLRSGPKPSWFEPAYRRAILLADVRHRYGLVRVFTDGTESVHYDFEFFDDRQGLAWALDAQWGRRSQESDRPRLPYDVYYFVPDEPLRLRLVIEYDDEDEAGEENSEEADQ